MNDLLDLVVDAATAVGSDSPELGRVMEVKQDRRLTVKVDYAAPLLPQSLKIGGHNPVATLHELASEGIHKKSEDECTEIFDRCKLAFEFVLKNLKVTKEEAEEFLRAMDSLTRKETKQQQQ